MLCDVKVNDRARTLAILKQSYTEKHYLGQYTVCSYKCILSCIYVKVRRKCTFKADLTQRRLQSNGKKNGHSA